MTSYIIKGILRMNERNNERESDRESDRKRRNL